MRREYGGNAMKAYPSCRPVAGLDWCGTPVVLFAAEGPVAAFGGVHGNQGHVRCSWCLVLKLGSQTDFQRVLRSCDHTISQYNLAK